MATVGELVVNIIARTKPFEQGMKRSADSTKRLEEASGKASKKVTELDGGLSKISRSLNGLVANAAKAAVGMLTFGAVISTVKNRMAELDALAKQSDRIGMNMENLQAMGFAAEQSGIAFDRFASIMDGFAKRMGEAKLGMGEAKTVLDQLGISVAKFTSMPLDQQVTALADIIQGTPSHAARMGITTKLFEDPAMLNLLSQGSDGIGELMDQAKSLGVVSRSSAADIEQANDAMNRLRKSIQGLTGELAVSAAPMITAVADELTDTMRVYRLGVGGVARFLHAIDPLKHRGFMGLPIGGRGAGTRAVDRFSRHMRAEGQLSGDLSPGVHAVLSGINRIGGMLGLTDDNPVSRRGTPRIAEAMSMDERKRIQQLMASAGAASGVGAMVARNAGRVAGAIESLGRAAMDAARPLGEMARGAGGLMDRLVQQGQQFQMMSGLRNVAGFGANFAAMLAAPLGLVDFSQAFQMHGTSADNRAILRGSREDIDREQNRAREKQLEIERQQLKALQDAVRALTDPGKILSFLSLDGGSI